MIKVRGASFVDEHGRTLLLRGVNLGGSSKIPRSPDGATHLPDGLGGHRHVSFVGRPFPLDEADEHFGRLASWGFTFLRFLVTWEAIEHEGPGIYDEAYLDYVRAVVERAQRHGISLFIDPHQDMWSRFSGGDGAPGWTLEEAGFDLSRLDATGAAITHQRHGNPLTPMTWVTNGGKLAAATMFTLFFGGSDFAPGTTVNGQPIQDFLQGHYIAAMAHLAARLRGMPNVAGYGVMNEPLCGYIGWEDLTVPHGQLTLGDGPSPFQGMALGEGIPQAVGFWTMHTASIRRTSTRTLNTERIRAWRTGRECVWKENGVWALDGAGIPVFLRPDHFVRVGSRRVSFTDEYLRPFAERYVRAIRSADPQAIIFLEAEANAAPPKWDTSAYPCVAFAPHWYDELTMVKNRYLSFAGLETGAQKLVLGKRAIRRSFREQLLKFKRSARERIGDVPTVIAEFGIPFAMRAGAAYRTGDFRMQVKALDRSYRAMEEALVGNLIWNYTPDNTNARGDMWNREDLSIFSRDQQAEPNDPNSGGRALEALLRPWPRAVAGEPLRISFDIRTRAFVFEFRHDPKAGTETEIYVPRWHYPQGYEVSVSDGRFEQRAREQLLVYMHSSLQGTHWVRISRTISSHSRGVVSTL
jgi:hypothetical protein